jgi:hypothetical protein
VFKFSICATGAAERVTEVFSGVQRKCVVLSEWSVSIILGSPPEKGKIGSQLSLHLCQPVHNALHIGAAVTDVLASSVN